jgi:hypothetical protein
VARSRLPPVSVLARAPRVVELKEAEFLAQRQLEAPRVSPLAPWTFPHFDLSGTCEVPKFAYHGHPGRSAQLLVCEFEPAAAPRIGTCG